MNNDLLSLEGMEFYGYHGALVSEKEMPQKFIVNIWMEVFLGPAGCKDDLTLTIDYGDIYRRVKKIVEQKSFNLIESLAETIAAEVLSGGKVRRVGVRVEKPWAPLGGPVNCAAVEIWREGRI